MTDPISITRKAFWDCINANSYFQQYVREGNRISFEDEIGLKANVGHGDLPEIIIVPEGFSQESLGTSGTCYLSINYRTYISTGLKNVESISILQWELYRTIQTFCAVCGRYAYSGNRFMTKATMQDGTQTISDSERNRGIEGWVASWGVKVDMVFSRGLVEYEVPESETENDD